MSTIQNASKRCFLSLGDFSQLSYSSYFLKHTAHRFTWVENNLVVAGKYFFSILLLVACHLSKFRVTHTVTLLFMILCTATDMPDYDDRKELGGEDEEQAQHYSKTQERGKLYGEEKVYINRNVDDERIVMKTQVSSSAVSSTA